MSMSDGKDVKASVAPSTSGSTAATFGMAAANTSAAGISSPSGQVAKKTIRIDVKLFEPTATDFPEINYAKLLFIEKKKQKRLAKSNGFSDPFEDNDDDVSRIAKECERKYGNAYLGKNSGLGSCYDKGAGYDENDDFIDNTEAYDENVPDEIDTHRGGFYINSGLLEFHTLSNFERPEDALRMPKAKKRALSTSSESSVEAESSAGVNPGAGQPKNGHMDKKAKANDKAQGSDSGKDSGTKAAVVKTTTVKDMLRAKRDSMRNMVDGGTIVSSDDAVSGSESSDESSDEDDENDEDDDDDEDENGDENIDTEGVMDGKEPSTVSHKPNSVNGEPSTIDVKLPENLSAELLSDIHKLTESAKVNSGSKSNFFDPVNAELLYKIDTAARSVGGAGRNNVRTIIFNYLERFLPCTKQTLKTHAKKCRLQREEAKAHTILKQLKLAVNVVMPDILAQHEEECARITEQRATATRNGESKEQLAALKMPKLRFLWNSTTRSLNWEMINVRRQSFITIKPRRETLEMFVQRFLKEHALKIWPEGVMRVEELIREFEKHNKSASRKNKDKKGDTQLPKVDTASTTTTTTTTTIPSIYNDPAIKGSSSNPGVISTIPYQVNTSNAGAFRRSTAGEHSASNALPPLQSESLIYGAKSTYDPYSNHSTTPTPPPRHLLHSPPPPPNPQSSSSSLSLPNSSAATTTTTTNHNHSTSASTAHRVHISAEPSSGSVAYPSPIASPSDGSNNEASDFVQSSTGKSDLRILSVGTLNAAGPSPAHSPALSRDVKMEIGGGCHSTTVSPALPPGKPITVHDLDEDELSSDVEFVSEMAIEPPPSKRSKPAHKSIQINRKKYLKNIDSRSNSPNPTGVSTTTIATTANLPDEPMDVVTAGDKVDFNNIMKALKELQPIQSLTKHRLQNLPSVVVSPVQSSNNIIYHQRRPSADLARNSAEQPSS